MAHLAPQAAIFSPSVARAAASAAKDWSYIDAWLQSKYRGQGVPAFERNADTLKALLAVASHNETADEERDQLARIEEAALQEAEAAEADRAQRRGRATGDGGGGADELHGDVLTHDLLDAIEDGLTREGRSALDAMAAMAEELGMALPTPEGLACRFVQLQCKASALEQMMDRVEVLQRYLARESSDMDRLVSDLRGDEYKPAPDLAKQNLELQRKVKSMSAKLPDLRRELDAMERSVGMPRVTVEEVRQEEVEYAELLSRKKRLDLQVNVFAGLPPDLDAARAELDSVRDELRRTTEQRDAVFGRLVESPAKVRRWP